MTDTDFFYESKMAFVYNSMPGNGLLARTVINMNVVLHKFAMPHKELSPIANSIYTGTVTLYSEKEIGNKNHPNGRVKLFLNGIYVSPELFIRFDNKFGVTFKNQKDHFLSEFDLKLHRVFMPLFNFLLDKTSDEVKDILGVSNDAFLKFLKELRTK